MACVMNPIHATVRLDGSRQRIKRFFDLREGFKASRVQVNDSMTSDLDEPSDRLNLDTLKGVNGACAQMQSLDGTLANGGLQSI